MIEIHEDPDSYFERSLAADLRRRASAAGLTVGELATQADLNRRTFERWLIGETTLGLRRYLALRRVVVRAEKMHERAERRLPSGNQAPRCGRLPNDSPPALSMAPVASNRNDV